MQRLGVDQRSCPNLQFRRDSIWLDDMFRQLQQVPQHDLGGQCRCVAYKRVQQPARRNIFIRHHW